MLYFFWRLPVLELNSLTARTDFFPVSRERAGLRLTQMLLQLQVLNSTLILYKPFFRDLQNQAHSDPILRLPQMKVSQRFNLIIAVNSVLCPIIFWVSLVLKTGRIYYYFWSTRITIFFFKEEILSSTVTVIISQTAGFTQASKATKTIAGPVYIVQSELHCTAANSQRREFQITLSSSGQVRTNCIQRFQCPQKKPRTSGFPF